MGRAETLGTRLEIQVMVVGGEAEIPFQRVILIVAGSERINHFILYYQLLYRISLYSLTHLFFLSLFQRNS